jgi:hypothetical protein
MTRLQPLDIAATLERLDADLPRVLVDTTARADLGRFARRLPPMFHWLLVETRLTERDRSEVDLLAAVVGERERCAELADAPALRAAPLVGTWARREDARLAGSHVLWLEWDAPFEREAPLQMVSLDPSFWGPRDATTCAREQVEVAAAAHEATFGRPHDPRGLYRIEHAIAALPPAASALFSASLAPRGLDVDRLFVALPSTEAMAWLDAIGWPGDRGRAAALIRDMVASWEKVYLQVELTPAEVKPYLAVEHCQTGGTRSERRERRRFLDGLLRSGHTTAERVEALFAWEQSARDDVRSFHLKSVLSADDIAVKAYLGVHVPVR